MVAKVDNSSLTLLVKSLATLFWKPLPRPVWTFHSLLVSPFALTPSAISLARITMTVEAITVQRQRRGGGGAAEGVGGGGVSGRLSMIRVSKRQSRICSCVRRIHMDYLALAVEPLKDQRAIERKYFLIIMLDEPKKSAKQVCPCMLDELHLM